MTNPELTADHIIVSYIQMNYGVVLHFLIFCEGKKLSFFLTVTWYHGFKDRLDYEAEK